MAETARALERLAAVEAAVSALRDDDLLDFADIFVEGDPTPLREMAEAEMRRRNLSL
ncbi:hypothetical protein [Sphingomonas sp. Leaf231]|uniref:hypothetical protein n=1 Tax=Sphingomonas sp. Leaf231 TaxID=1736301 RepID=UPI001F46B845|nr:hypothetical protein [Sphingomonas sp. Leaf231]